MAVLLMYNAQDSYTVEQIHEHTQIKMVGARSDPEIILYILYLYLKTSSK